jgi:glycosyltransferase involved in cell wall biosynthesis
MKALGKTIVHTIRIIGSGKVSLLANEVHKVIRHIVWCDNRSLSLKPEGRSNGNVLLSYINDPFYLAPGVALPNTHTHYWESLQIATTFLELGYCVDVVRYSNQQFTPTKDYGVVIDARTNLERLAPLLPKDCVKIMHLDTAHWLFHNAAQHRRLLDLQQRRGVALQPCKTVTPNRGIEHADCGTILGNEFTASTYGYADKPIYRLHISTPVLFPWPEEKDFDACRRQFLWFGSAGLVHKGLDLVLEAFAEMPQYRLTVCGPITGEKAFEHAYHKELYGTANIETIGWVDIGSPRFREIANRCLGIVYPSCSEGGGGGVITCMHAALIPIVSREASVDIQNDYGVLLRDCSIKEIQHSVRRLSSMPVDQLRNMSRHAWEYVRAKHTQQHFAQEYHDIVRSIISRFANGQRSTGSTLASAAV